MTARMSEARRAAFLRAVEETGNQTVAAERARVSRSWACLHRSRDAAFDSAVRAAVAAARERLSRLESSAPPREWGHLDGEELVVRGTGGSGGGKRVQIARARLRQWTPRLEARFLQTLAATCNVTAACASVGLGKCAAYAHRKRWRAFARRWDETISEAVDRLEWALLQAGANLFSSPAAAPRSTPIRAMCVSEAIWIVEMRRRLEAGMAGTPGRRPLPRPLEEVKAGILRKFSALERQWRRGHDPIFPPRSKDAWPGSPYPFQIGLWNPAL